MRKARIAIAAAAAIALSVSACSGGALDASGESENVAQLRREAVHRNFAERDEAAIKRYKAKWENRGGLSRTQEDEIELLAIATRLVSEDPQNAPTYRAYVESQLSSRSASVRASAAAALGEFEDESSLRKLVELLDDAHLEVQAEAAAALEFRHETMLTKSPRVGGETDVAFHLRAVCAGDKASVRIEMLCERVALR